jgi:hypothetical protein
LLFLCLIKQQYSLMPSSKNTTLKFHAERAVAEFAEAVLDARSEQSSRLCASMSVLSAAAQHIVRFQLWTPQCQCEPGAWRLAPPLAVSAMAIPGVRCSGPPDGGPRKWASAARKAQYGRLRRRPGEAAHGGGKGRGRTGGDEVTVGRSRPCIITYNNKLTDPTECYKGRIEEFGCQIHMNKIFSAIQGIKIFWSDT